MKKMIWAFLLAFLLGIPALAEDWEDEWLFVDLSGESLVSYNAVKWNFPVDIADMDPELIVLVNKSMFLDKKYEPAGLVKMKSLKLDKQGKKRPYESKFVNLTTWFTAVKPFERGLFDNLQRMQFEDAMLYVPREYDKVLSQCYGDYMKLPPADQQIAHHYYTAYLLEDEQA